MIRECPAGPGYDTVLAVEEDLGVILAAGLRLHELAGLEWISFPRSEAPAWYDQVAATLRSHGIVEHDRARPGEHPLIAEVKLAAVATGRTFALAPPECADPQPSVPLPGGVTWRPLIGNPAVRRTWAAWPASSRQRDLAAIAALDVTMR